MMETSRWCYSILEDASLDAVQRLQRLGDTRGMETCLVRQGCSLLVFCYWWPRTAVIAHDCTETDRCSTLMRPQDGPLHPSPRHAQACSAVASRVSVTSVHWQCFHAPICFLSRPRCFMLPIVRCPQTLLPLRSKPSRLDVNLSRHDRSTRNHCPVRIVGRHSIY